MVAAHADSHPLVDAVAALERDLDRFVGGAWDGLEPTLVRELAERLSRVQARIDAQKLHAARRLEATGAAKSAGVSSTGQLLAGDFGGDRRSADQVVKLAKSLEAASPTQTALDRGDISLGQSQVIAKALQNVPDGHRELAERGLLRDAPDLNLTDLRRRADRIPDTWTDQAETDRIENQTILERERRARANAKFRIWDNRDGTYSGDFTIPEAQGELLKAVVEAISAPRRDHLKHPADQGPIEYAHRLGMGFADLCEHLPTTELPNAGGVGATLTVNLDLQTLTDGVRAASLATGTRLSAEQTRKLACRVGIIPQVLDGDSLPLDFGTEKRYFTRPQRIALANRDGGCTYPGCDRPPQWCDAHHLKPVSTGGPTTLDNGVLLCTFHHHVVHDQGVATRRATDGIIEYRRPDQTEWQRNHRYRP